MVALLRAVDLRLLEISCFLILLPLVVITLKKKYRLTGFEVSNQLTMLTYQGVVDA